MTFSQALTRLVDVVIRFNNTKLLSFPNISGREHTGVFSSELVFAALGNNVTSFFRHVMRRQHDISSTGISPTAI